MNCPVCKNDNPQGATHCGVCYEVFSRSAAEAHLRSLRKERLQHEKERGSSALPSETETLRQSIDRLGNTLKDTLPPLDWKEGIRQARGLAEPYRKMILIGGGVIGALLLLFLALSLHLWSGVFGVKPVYRFSDKGSVRYLSSFSSDVKTWSERGAQLDTPLEKFHIDELGNFDLMPVAGHKTTQVNAQAREWIAIKRDSAHSGSRSVVVPLSNPSLKGGSITLDEKGKITRRDFPANSRMGRAFYFLTPDLPNTHFKPGDTWKSTIAWVEQIGDWKVYWSGTVDWIFTGSLTDNIDALSFNGRAQLTPQIWDGPSWASGQTKAVRFTGSPAEATMVFDQRFGRVSARRISYQGRLDFPLNDLARIPWDLRVGRRVHGPGRILLDLSNRYELRQN